MQPTKSETCNESSEPSVGQGLTPKNSLTACKIERVGYPGGGGGEGIMHITVRTLTISKM